METERLDDLLELADFTKYEKEIYLTLCRINRGTVTDIYNESKVPQPKVYTVLERLHEKGYVSLEGTNPKSYSIIDPEPAFSGMIDSRRQKVEELESLVKQASNEIENNPNEEKFLRIIRGRETVLDFLADELANNTSEEYLTLGRLVSTHTPLQPIMKRKADNIDLKILGPKKTSKEIVVQKYINMGVNVKLRDLPATPFRFSVHDRERLAFTLSDSGDGYLTVWTNYPSFVQNMQEFFEYQWSEAEKP